jgi:hypothetical protein
MGSGGIGAQFLTSVLNGDEKLHALVALPAGKEPMAPIV